MRGEKGFSILQVLVAIGLMSIVGAGMATMSVNSFKASMSAEASMNTNTLNLEVISSIGNSELCTATLQNKAINVMIPELTDTIKSNSNFSDKVMVGQIEINNVNPFSSNYKRATLNVPWVKTGDVYGRKKRVFTYTIYIREVGGVIQDCIGGEVKTGEYYCVAIGGTWQNGACIPGTVVKDQIVSEAVSEICDQIQGYHIVNGECVLISPVVSNPVTTPAPASPPISTPPTSSPPTESRLITGACSYPPGGIHNQCLSGVLSRSYDNGNTYFWTCSGSNGGQDAQCSVAKSISSSYSWVDTGVYAGCVGMAPSDTVYESTSFRRGASCSFAEYRTRKKMFKSADGCPNDGTSGRVYTLECR